MKKISHLPLDLASADHAGVQLTVRANSAYTAVSSVRKNPTHTRGVNKARRLDQFYTIDAVARSLLDQFEAKRIDHGLCLHRNLRYVEPSAGTGAFAKHLPLGSLAYDIDPKGPGIIKADFLQTSFPQNGQLIVIGNPPFGKNANMAVKFFNYAAQAAEVIAFIVPLTFQKVSVQNRLHLNFHLIDELPLPDNAFLFEGRSKHVPAIFQIWAKRSTRRQKLKLATSHPDFKFLTGKDGRKPQFAIQRVGTNAGRVHRNLEASPSTHYFIEAGPGIIDLETVFRQLNLKDIAARTAGQPSLAKTELVSLYTNFRRQGTHQAGFNKDSATFAETKRELGA